MGIWAEGCNANTERPNQDLKKKKKEQNIPISDGGADGALGTSEDLNWPSAPRWGKTDCHRWQGGAEETCFSFERSGVWALFLSAVPAEKKPYDSLGLSWNLKTQVWDPRQPWVQTLFSPVPPLWLGPVDLWASDLPFEDGDKTTCLSSLLREVGKCRRKSPAQCLAHRGALHIWLLSLFFKHGQRCEFFGSSLFTTFSSHSW